MDHSTLTKQTFNDAYKSKIRDHKIDKDGYGEDGLNREYITGQNDTSKNDTRLQGFL